jgi:hypothetical protein
MFVCPCEVEWLFNADIVSHLVFFNENKSTDSAQLNKLSSCIKRCGYVSVRPS